MAKNSKIGMADALFWGVAIFQGTRMVINTNVASASIANMMRASVRRMNDSIGRLSSGSRIMNPADDAAGLAVATKFTSQMHRLDAARNSLANTLSYVQTADGYMQKVEKGLSRMGELAALAMDKTKSSSDLENYNSEFQELKEYIRDVQGKKMNGLNLFQGETIAVTNGAFGQTHSFNTTDLSATSYSRAVDFDVYTPPPYTWEVTKDVWTTSVAGYMLREDANKILETHYTIKSGANVWQLNADAWYKASTGWAAADNGGTKYNLGSFVKMGAVATHPTITHDIMAQLGGAAADYYTAGQFISKTNPAVPGNGNIEASDIQTNAANTFTTIDPSLMAGALAPSYTFYSKGSFTTDDPTSVLNSTMNIGDVVAVNPITSLEDTGATLYAAGSVITASDPTDPDVDPNAEELSPSHVLTSGGAYWAITKVKTALEQLSTDRASSGSVMGRLHRINDQLGLLRENLDQAVSRIRDTNVAAESTRYARHHILMNTSTDMLKQANIVPQHALRLILGL